MTPKIKSRVEHVWKILQSPHIFFDFSWTDKKGQFLLLGWGWFLAIWAISNQFWKFPWFWVFFAVFSLIQAISFGTLKYFYPHMRTLREDLAGWDIFTKANYFYMRTCKTCINIYFPLFFILAFGVGGCILYTKVWLTPTFILYMIYFSVMVYFSMVVYLQYVRFFLYLHLATQDNSLVKLAQSNASSGKLRVQWLQDMNDIACAMRNMFASVGLLYIGAFALFCFSPAYGASFTAPIFYFLWILIAIFVVIVFLVVNSLNSVSLHKLRSKVKQAYVDELIFWGETPDGKDRSEVNQFMTLLRQICAATILSSNDFPVEDARDWVLSAGITTIQVVASVATLYQFQIS